MYRSNVVTVLKKIPVSVYLLAILFAYYFATGAIG
jgi:hypothetical protein